MCFGWMWCINVGLSLVKRTILVNHVDSGGGYAYAGMSGIWELSILSSQFSCNYKTALKNNLIK